MQITEDLDCIDFLTNKINSETPEFGSAFPFGFSIRNDAGEIIAGVNGSIVYGSIYTDQLWVDPIHRKSGIGKMLMEKVHQYGKEHGCNTATASTMSFQGALKFYESQGYKVDFERKDYVMNSSCLYLRREL